MNFNPHIHHRKSIRLKGYDYSQEGIYFITICCYERKSFMGNIADGIMTLNGAGKMANACWLEIPNHFPNVILHEYIIMPNHVHGIIELTNDNEYRENVGAQNFVPLLRGHSTQQNKFQKIIPHSIGSIIRGYKIGVTKWFRANADIETVWQRNYYEHIIRNERSHQIIADYIINNPSRWNNDKFFMH